MVVKLITFAHAREGGRVWEEKLSQLDAPPSQILIGMEATSRYGENLYHELEQRAFVQHLVVNDQLKYICQIEQSRHRSPINFLVNLVAGLSAYCHQPNPNSR